MKKLKLSKRDNVGEAEMVGALNLAQKFNYQEDKVKDETEKPTNKPKK